MSTTMPGRPIKRWVESVPEQLPDGLVRYYIYWKIFYPLAGLTHFIVMLFFLQTGILPLAIFGVFSVATYIAAYVLLTKGYLKLALWIAILELILHGLAATVLIGPQYGFQNFSLLVLILLFIQPFYGAAVSTLLAAMTLASAGLATYYASNNPPLYFVPEAWSLALTVTIVVLWPTFVLIMVLPFIRAAARAERDLQAAYGESERLLLNILPEAIARRLKSTLGMIADDHDRVAVLFVDIVGFTALSERLPPAEVVAMLNEIFNTVDDLVEKYGAEKIKTIGDAYMVAVGLPDPVPDPEADIARLALEIRSALSGITIPGTDDPVRVRIGINSGKVVAGVIGNRKFAYDLWGDTVNLAARMEATSLVGKIQLTDELAARLAGRFDFTPRGEIDVKGKGKVATSFLEGQRVPSALAT